jgi:hypothetical protein
VDRIAVMVQKSRRTEITSGGEDGEGRQDGKHRWNGDGGEKRRNGAAVPAAGGHRVRQP